MYRHYLAFILIMCLGQVNAQRLRFSQINIKNGLSQSTVHAVIQDTQGYVWFGTEDGLNRFDGINMAVFNDDVDQPDNLKMGGRFVTKLCLDEHGDLWVGTNNGGVSKWLAKEQRFENLDTTVGLSSNRINDLLIQGNRVLVATDMGVDQIDIQSLKTKSFAKYEDGFDVRTLFLDGEILWLGTQGHGLFEIDLTKNKMSKGIIPLNAQGELLKKNADKVRSIFKDSSGQYWIGFYGAGLAQYDNFGHQFKFFKSSGKGGFKGRKVEDIYQDSEGNMWFATDRGLATYAVGKRLPGEISFTFYQSNEDDPLSIADNNVLCVYEDEANSLWFGTQLGASVYHRTLGKFNHVKSGESNGLSLMSKKVYAFTEDQSGNIWVGSDGGGISRLSFENETIDHFLKEDTRTNNTIIAATTSKDGIVWFGSYGAGLNGYDPKTGTFLDPISKDSGLPSSTILSLESDSKHNLYIGTFKGLIYYDRQQDTLINLNDQSFADHNARQLALPSKRIQTLKIVSKVLWVGTDKGLFSMNLANNQLYLYDEQAGLSNNEVYGIAEDLNGQIWVGTKNGLNKINPNDHSIQTFTSKDGLQSNFIYGVLVDSDNALWLSTNNGITKFNPNLWQGKRYYVRHYNAIDGLQADEFNQGAYFKSASGELFFGGVNGFNHFMPQNIVDNDHQARIGLKSFKISNKDIDLNSMLNEDNVLELSYRDNFLEFEFSAHDFVLPEKNLYQFKMEGLDEHWSTPSSRNHVSYKDLKSGEYTLLVKVANNDGVWSEHIYKLKIYIKPPFWETTWFYALCVLFVLLSIFLFVRLRMRKIKREKRILEEKVDERTRELAAKTEELAEKNKDITDSIEYAKKIQTAILPDEQYLYENLPDMFVLYIPKDIVSGDFYWFGVKNGLKIITAVDCTGHGVPGAFMSMIGSNLLNQIVLEKGITEAGEILENLNRGVQNSLKQGTSAQETNDGMDISLCVIDDTKLKLQWAGAYNPLYHIRNGELTKFKANKYPIGGAHMTLERSYETHELDLEKGDTVYMFSDGFVDQFGGEKGKKFMGKRFQKLLLDNCNKPMSDQKVILDKTLKDWMRHYEQIDDVCVIGVRI